MNAYDGNIIEVIRDMHPELAHRVDYRVRNDHDSYGDKITNWNPTVSPAPEQPTPAELLAVWNSTTADRINKTRLTRYAQRTGMVGVYQVTDPLAAVARPDAPVTLNDALRYIALRKISWATEVDAPTVSPRINADILAARNSEDDWYLATGRVLNKITDGTYTTEADIDNAAEWPS